MEEKLNKLHSIFSRIPGKIREERDKSELVRLTEELDKEHLDSEFDIGVVSYPSVLWYCCYKGYLGLVSILLEKECDREIVNEEGKTILLTSVEWERSALVEMISSKFPEMVLIPDKEGNTSLMLAVEKENKEILNKLIEKIPVEVKYDFFSAINNLKKNVLMVTVEKENVEILKIILDNIPSEKLNDFLNLQDEDGNTALMLALKNYNKRNVEYLLSIEGVDHKLDIINSDQKSVLMLISSSRIDNIDILEKLFPNPIEDYLNLQDKDGNTALMLAIINRNSKVVDLLLNKIHDFTLFNKNNENVAFLLAKHIEEPDLIIKLHKGSIKRGTTTTEFEFKINGENENIMYYLKNKKK